MRKHLGFRGKTMSLYGEQFYRVAEQIMQSDDAVAKQLLNDWIDARTAAVEAMPASVKAESEDGPSASLAAEMDLREHLGFRGRSMNLRGEGFSKIATNIMESNDQVAKDLLWKWISARSEDATKALEQRAQEVLAQREAAATSSQRRKPALSIAWDNDIMGPLIAAYGNGNEDAVGRKGI